LQRKAELDAQETKTHVPDLPERQTRFAAHVLSLLMNTGSQRTRHGTPRIASRRRLMGNLRA
jgi:hypothetical protein